MLTAPSRTSLGTNSPKCYTARAPQGLTGSIFDIHDVDPDLQEEDAIERQMFQNISSITRLLLSFFPLLSNFGT